MKAMSLIASIMAESVDDGLQFNQFNFQILRVFDAIAPVKAKMVSGKQKAPWRNASAVTNQGRECRKAECKCRKTKLWID